MAEIWGQLDLFDDAIKTLKDQTSKKLYELKSQLLKKVDSHYVTYSEELMADSRKKKQNDEDPHLREQTLNKKLEKMTSHA